MKRSLSYMLIIQLLLQLVYGFNIQEEFGLIEKKSRLLKTPKPLSKRYKVKLSVGDTVKILSKENKKYYNIQFGEDGGWLSKKRVRLLPINVKKESNEIDVIQHSKRIKEKDKRKESNNNTRSRKTTNYNTGSRKENNKNIIKDSGQNKDRLKKLGMEILIPILLIILVFGIYTFFKKLKNEMKFIVRDLRDSSKILSSNKKEIFLWFIISHFIAFLLSGVIGSADPYANEHRFYFIVLLVVSGAIYLNRNGYKIDNISSFYNFISKNILYIVSIFLSGLVFQNFPDWDLFLPFLGHRSIVTHSVLIFWVSNYLLNKYPNYYSNNKILINSIYLGIVIGVTSHLFVDISYMFLISPTLFLFAHKGHGWMPALPSAFEVPFLLSMTIISINHLNQILKMKFYDRIITNVFSFQKLSFVNKNEAFFLLFLAINNVLAALFKPNLPSTILFEFWSLVFLILSVIIFLKATKKTKQSEPTATGATGLIFKNPKSSFLWSQDFFNNKSIITFYNMKEAIVAYRNTHEIEGRRSIAKEVEIALDSFIKHDFKEHEVEFLLMLSNRNKDLIEELDIIDEDLYKLMKKVDNVGLELLDIPKNINLAVLKKCYRSASLKYHPDKGGSHEKMTKLNGAYTRFYDIIESHSSIKKLAVSFSTPSEWDDWLFSCYITKACINADFFAADLIIEPFKKAYKHAQLSNNNYIGQYVMDLEGFEGNVFSRPTYTLHRFGMFEEWKESRKITHYFYDRIIKDQVPDEYGDILTSSYFGDTMIKNLTEDNFNKTIPRLVIRHIEQAKNSYRLEKIDSKRFKSLMKRFNVRSVEKQSYFDDIDNFIKNNDFFVEVNDYKYKKDIMKGNIIRDVSFKQKRYHHLTPQQKWEYLKTFNEKKDSQLIDKYLFIRSQDIMLGIINNFEKIDRNILKNEIQFFAKNEECSAHIEFQNLIEMIKYLESLDKKHRREVCQILSELDNEEYEENNMSITIGLDYEINPEFIISSNDDYIEFAQTDLKTLKIYQQTGRLPDVHINDWNNALSNIEKLEKTKIGKRYNDVWLQVKTPSPDLIIETAKPYLEELLKIGKKINPKYTGELQIGYVINRLTIAYAKQKDWEQVRYWGELFFNLPMRYRSRSNNSEKEVLRKRIERAISQMGK